MIKMLIKYTPPPFLTYRPSDSKQYKLWGPSKHLLTILNTLHLTKYYCGGKLTLSNLLGARCCCCCGCPPLGVCPDEDLESPHPMVLLIYTLLQTVLMGP